MEYRDTATDELYDPADLPVQVCNSAAGYFIGQVEPCGVPFSRLSDRYYKTHKEAEAALDTGWQGGRMENVQVELKLIAKGAIRGSNGVYQLVRGEN